MKKGRIKEIAIIVKERFKEADVANTSVLIAFYMLLSIFPIAIGIGNILPLLKIDPISVTPYLSAILPESIEPILVPIIEDLLTQSSGGVFIISILILLWSASRGVSQIERGINMAYGLAGSQNGIVRRIVSVFVLIVICAFVIGAVLIFSLGGMLLDNLKDIAPIAVKLDGYLRLLKWPVTVALAFATLTIIYKLMPSVKIKFRDAWPGALFAMIGWVALVEGFSIYLRFSNMSTYGVLSTFIILMIWLVFAGVIILVGAVLNATLYTEKYGKPEIREGKLPQRTWDKLAGYLQNRIFSKRDKTEEARRANRKS